MRWRGLAAFLYLVFNIDVDYGEIGKIIFPIFEETLVILDLAERRHESLKDFDVENTAVIFLDSSSSLTFLFIPRKSLAKSLLALIELVRMRSCALFKCIH